VTIKQCSTTGTLDQHELTQQLTKWKQEPSCSRLVGSFAAASNVTGIMEQVDQITALLHTHGALACWDYAAAVSIILPLPPISDQLPWPAGVPIPSF
jgi:selenocysteine lyase/cysteine desulfurase